MKTIELEEVYDDVIAEHEESKLHKYQWRKLFRTVVYATFIGSFLAFAALYLLVVYVVPAIPHV
jgi:hypothetical protein